MENTLLIEFCSSLWQMTFANQKEPFQLKGLKQNLSIFYMSGTKDMCLWNGFYKTPISIYKKFCFVLDISWFDFMYNS